MKQNLIFHQTKHFSVRVVERGLQIDYVKAVIQYPNRIRQLGRGSHGGFLKKFWKKDGKTLVVVAEIKKSECWILTAYYED